MYRPNITEVEETLKAEVKMTQLKTIYLKTAKLFKHLYLTPL